MKKLVCFIGFLIIFILPMDFIVSAAAYNTKAIEAVKGTPAIDGKMDDIWNETKKEEVKLVNQTIIPSKSTTTGVCYTMWDDMYFYILIDVRDSAVFETGGTVAEDIDSVEIGFDELNSKGRGNVCTGAQDPAAGVFRVGVNNQLSGFGNKYENDLLKFKGAAKKTNSGYIVEMAIPFSSLKPEANKVVSMEVQINDSSNGGGRTGLITWNSDQCLGWQDSESHGEVKLSAKTVSNFTAASSRTSSNSTSSIAAATSSKTISTASESSSADNVSLAASTNMLSSTENGIDQKNNGGLSPAIYIVICAAALLAIGIVISLVLFKKKGISKLFGKK